MKKFKQTLAVFTAVLMLCFVLPFFTACGDESARPDRPKNSESPYTSQLGDTSKPTSEQTVEPTTESTPEPVPVVFHDPTFEAAFRNKYGYSGKVITESTVLSYTKLELPGCELTDITDAAMFSNLTKLDLGYYEDNFGEWHIKQISDISPLSGLTNLTSLKLGWNGITDAKLVEFANALSGLTNLTELDLSWNEITDISPLSGFTELTELDLDYNQISDISPLSELTELTRLDLTWNQISDTSPLSGLINLTKLELKNNKLTSETDVSLLFDLILLKTLYIKSGMLTQSQIDAIQESLPNCKIK